MKEVWFALAALSAGIQGYVNVMQKKLVTGSSSSVFSFIFNFFCLIFLIPFIPLVQFSIFPIAIIFATRFLTIIAFYFRTKALKVSNVSEVFPLVSSLQPLFVFIMAFLFIGERITVLNFLGMLIIIFGCFSMVSDFKLKIKDRLSIYHGLILISSLFYAMNAVVIKFLLNHGVNIFTILFFSTMFTTLGFLPLIKFKSRKILPTLEAKLGGFIVAGLFTAIYRFFAIIAMDIGPVSLVSATRRLQSPISVFLAGKLLKEEKWKLKLLAAILILIGIYLII